MRKLVVAYLVTLDGVHRDPMSWTGSYFDDAAVKRALVHLRRSDGFLMGRGGYEYFQPSWPQASGPYPDRINAMPKYVFSSTLPAADWNNTTMVADDPVTAVAALKDDGDGDLVLYGYTRLARSLLGAGLVDELQTNLFPVIEGRGHPCSTRRRAYPFR